MPKSNIDDTIEEFLKHISQLETSGGKNLAHKVVQVGPLSGYSAVGQYGLMPPTIADTVHRLNNMDQRAANRLPSGVESPPLSQEEIDEVGHRPSDLTEGFDPDGKRFRQGAQQMANQVEADPDAEHQIAHALAMRLLQKTGGDQDRAAYMWNSGSNRNPNNITPQMMHPDDMMSDSQKEAANYAQHYHALSQVATPDVPQLEEDPTPKKFAKLTTVMTGTLTPPKKKDNADEEDDDEETTK